MIASCDPFPRDLCSIFKVIVISFWNPSLEVMYIMLSEFQKLSFKQHI